MTILPSKAERDAIGIDTYERAILYAAMMLRRSFLIDGEKANLKRLSITSAQAKEKNNILIEGEFPYSNSQTWEKGGDVFKPVHYLSLGDPSNSFSPPSSLIPFGSPYISLSSEPSWVETLEEFFIWLLSQSKASLHLESPPRHEVISYRFFDARSPLPIVEVKATLPFDVGIWLRDRHFFNSLYPLLRYSPTIRGVMSSSVRYLSTITNKINGFQALILAPQGSTKPVYFSIISSEFKYLRIIRNNLITFVRLSTITSQDLKTTVDSSEFTTTTTVTRISSFNKVSKFRAVTTINVIKSRHSVTTQVSIPRYISEITSNEQVLVTDLLVGGWKAKVTIEIKPDLIEKDLYSYPLFIHPNDIRKVFDKFVGKIPNTNTVSKWQETDITPSFRAKQLNGNLLPIYTAVQSKKPDGVGSFTDFTPDYYEGGIWILLPFLKSSESTFVDLYFLDLFNNIANDFGSNIPYPANRFDVFAQYHWWSFYLREEGNYSSMITNLGTATVNSSQAMDLDDNDQYPFATNTNSNNHPFTVQSTSDFQFVNVDTGFIITNPINITAGLENPTLQTWQIGEVFTPIEFGNLILTSGDVTKTNVNEDDSRKISLNQNGGYFNDTFHNPRTIGSETIGSSSTLTISSSVTSNNIFLYNQIKLHKQQLSPQWIKTEYNNEINRTQFYDVKQIEYISAFNRITEINKNEDIPIPLRFKTMIKQDNPIALWEGLQNNNDVINGYNLLLQTQVDPLVSITKNQMPATRVNGQAKFVIIEPDVLNSMNQNFTWSFEMLLFVEANDSVIFGSKGSNNEVNHGFSYYKLSAYFYGTLWETDTSGAIPDPRGDFVHYVAIYEQVSGRKELYINNQLTVNSGHFNTVIGGGLEFSMSYATFFYLAIYDFALSSAQVQEHYNQLN